MTHILTRCPIIGCGVQTGITTQMVNFNSLPNVAVMMHCAACGGDHSWKPSDAWMETDDALSSETVQRFAKLGRTSVSLPTIN